ncbi:MAG TPA: hypothetical protein PLZ52_07155 [Bacteroidales bacterium]|nr:hypothetical protein [Bacteroidales bacterium]HQL70313.1 hypothetical protein [Bacteroidales bacterium]
MNLNKLLFSLLILVIVAIAACKPSDKKAKLEWEVNDVSWLTNYLPETTENKVLWLDYEGAIHGFTAPSARQTDNGLFNFEFTVKNTSDKAQRYYYKVYYQNETYKNPELGSNSNKIHPYAHENFYGSWEDSLTGFKPIGEIGSGEEKTIHDGFRIVGNPRNEEMYFFEGKNDRWKRNPRVGSYSSLLIVVTDEDLKRIPDYIQFIGKQSSLGFISPYYYFLFGEGKELTNTFVAKYDDIINLKATPDLGKGVFVEEYNFRDNPDFKKYFDCRCGNDAKIFEEATVTQFVHYVDPSSKFNNIPVIVDVVGEGYSKEEYNWNRAFCKKEELIGTTPQTAKYPCRSIVSDSVNKKIIIKNPATTYGEWRKENVGIITRHGFTYGKITVKAKLTELLNEDNVWNGLTNAIWMIYQGGTGQEKGWNLRRPCKKKGYMATYWGGRNDKRVERVGYSEIDFEILKTVPYCPANEFPPVYAEHNANQKRPADWNIDFPEDVKQRDHEIAVCCTNWDMACQSPDKFASGCNEISYQGKTFWWHRWEDVYRAVTEKYFIADDEVFGGDYYYFQIDWQPDKIIWRIGPEKNKLFVVGYVDESISMIPNNQMLLIVTQEFHNTQWWPGSPYLQENIPFPKNDIFGEIFEITIE